MSRRELQASTIYTPAVSYRIEDCKLSCVFCYEYSLCMYAPVLKKYLLSFCSHVRLGVPTSGQHLVVNSTS